VLKVQWSAKVSNRILCLAKKLYFAENNERASCVSTLNKNSKGKQCNSVFSVKHESKEARIGNLCLFRLYAEKKGEIHSAVL